MDQVTSEAATAPTPAPARDGRRMRGERTRAAVLAATRAFMADGNLRPRVGDIAARADVSVRSIFQHWVQVRELYLDALRDPATVAAIADDVRGLPDAEAVAIAFVLGELPARSQ